MDKSENVVNEVIERAGGVSALATRLGVSQQLVSYWRKKSRIPMDRIGKVCECFPEFTYQYLVDKSTKKIN